MVLTEKAKRLIAARRAALTPEVGFYVNTLNNKPPHVALVAYVGERAISFIAAVNGAFDLLEWDYAHFARTFKIRLDGYPVEQALRVYLSTTAFTRTDKGLRAINYLLRKYKE